MEPKLKKLALITLLYLLSGASSYADKFSDTKALAEQGDAQAQYKLGVMYDSGRGVPWDQGEAAKWYRKAAEQGHATAQYSLGGMYYHSAIFTDKGYAEAFKWNRKAAEQGHATAQKNLGDMYYDGHGVPQDYAEAYVWSSLAATNGNTLAVILRDSMARKLTPEALSAAQKRAAALLAEIQARKE